MSMTEVINKMKVTCTNCGYNPYHVFIQFGKFPPWSNGPGLIKPLWTLPNVGTNAYCPKCKQTFIY